MLARLPIPPPAQVSCGPSQSGRPQQHVILYGLYRTRANQIDVLYTTVCGVLRGGFMTAPNFPHRL